MPRSALIILGLGVIIVGGLLFAAAQVGYPTSTQQQEESTMEQATELGIEDVKVGEGEEAVDGKSVTVHYTGTFTDGRQFDSSRDRSPFTFTLGQGQVIQGWDQGVAGMKVGGVRKLTIPPHLGYGFEDHNSIPGGSTLLFDVELLEVK